MRLDILEGEKLFLIKNKYQIIVKKMKDFGKNIEEDLKFAEKTEQAFKRYEAGEFIEMELAAFIKQAEKW